MLSALSDELDAESLTSSVLLDAAFASTSEPQNRSGLYDRIYGKLTDIRSLREFSGTYKQDEKYEVSSKRYKLKNIILYRI